MNKLVLILMIIGSLAAASIGQEREKLDRIQQTLKDDAPHIVCIDERFATAGQPNDSAYAKLAENGYRAVLSLRTSSEGFGLAHEKEMVEKAGLRFINIPVVTTAPKPEQVTEFINAVKDKSNQPMLIHCGSANRVGAFWMIYRVVEQGWSEEKALEEAVKIGLTNPVLKSFAHEYIWSRVQNKAASG
ncbi:MAG TPA: protein tyrosine phosphatase family protein [Blastocatellia bacterium]|nr:protein tyrosine phosphatase family protein [Blastocatellia bacterium]